MGCTSSSYDRQFDLSTPYKEVRFLQKESRNTDRYFHHLYERIGHTHKAEEVPLIRKAVETLVGNLLLEAGSVDPRFRSSDQLITVGPFYQGVKIGFIDQFEYVAILEWFVPNSKNFLVERIDSLAYRLYVPEDNGKSFEFFKSWKKMIKNGYLKSSKNDNKDLNLLNGFSDCLQKAVRSIQPVVMPFGDVIFADNMAVCVKESRIEVRLIFRQNVVKIYQGKKNEEKELHIITVIITPAIKVTDIEEFVFEEDLIDKGFMDDILETDSFFLVPSGDGNFKGVFTETESNIIQGLSLIHKKAFCVLQFLICGIDDRDNDINKSPYQIFDLDILTQFIIHLNKSCPCLKPRFPEYEIFDCVIHVLNAMHASLYEAEGEESNVKKNLALLVQRKWNSREKGGPRCEAKLFWNRVYFRELLWHDLRNWIGTLEKYNLKLSRPLYGAVPLNQKLLQIDL